MARAIFRRCGCSKINDYGNKKETINRQLYIKTIISRTAACAYTLLSPLLTPGMKPKLYSNKKKKKLAYNIIKTFATLSRSPNRR